MGAIKRAELVKAQTLDSNELAKRPSRKKDEKKNAFLYQVATPIEMPTLKFGSESSMLVLTLNTLDEAEPEKRTTSQNVTTCRNSITKEVTETTQAMSLNYFLKDADDAKPKVKKVSKINSAKVKKVRLLRQPQNKKESIKNADDKSAKDERKTKIDEKSSIEIQDQDLHEILEVEEPTKPKYKRRHNINTKDQEAVSAEPPIPKPRKHSLPQSTNAFELEAPISQSQVSYNDDTWDLVAQHRKNTRAHKIGHQTTKSDLSKAHVDTLQMQQRQIDILTKPKTIREMRREQIDDSLTIVDNRMQPSAGIDRNGELKLNSKNVNEKSDTEA